MAAPFKVKRLAPNTTRVDIAIDTSGLRAFGADLQKKGYKSIYKAMQWHLTELGLILEDDAKRYAGQWSKSIPPTIKHQIRGMNVKVIAGPPQYTNTPHGGGLAAAMEHRGQGGTFRHPVFGDREKWVTQAAHPYLAPAVNKNRKAIIGACDAALKTGLRAVGMNSN